MKKIISLILVLMLCISLGACGGSTFDSNAENSTSTSVVNTTTQKVEQTTAQIESEEEKPLKVTKERYESANKYLTKYLSEGFFYISGQGTLRDNAALEYLYKEFEACGDYEDSKAILSRFTVLPDVLTSISNEKTDYLGTAKQYTYSFDLYDEKGPWLDYHDTGCKNTDVLGWQMDILNVCGSLVSAIENKNFINNGKFFEFALFAINENYFNYRYQCEYDDLTRVNAVKTFIDESLVTITKFEYDSNNNIVKAITQTSDGETYTSTYVYNAQNYLIAAERYVKDNYNLSLYMSTYSYDEEGNLVEEIDVCKQASGMMVYDRENEMRITAYTYDDNGHLLRKEFKWYSHCDNQEPEYMSVEEYSYDGHGFVVKLKKMKSALNDSWDVYETMHVEEFLYTNDENGRPISAELIETKNGKNNYASQILTYHYEDLYFYNAE